MSILSVLPVYILYGAHLLCFMTGMDESNPILRALKRSEAKMLNSKAVQEVSPTSTSEDVACLLPLKAILN